MADQHTAAVVSALRSRGYSVLPAPQHVELHEQDLPIDIGWELHLSNVPADDIAVRSLDQSALLRLDTGAGAIRGRLHLCVRPDAVTTGAEPLCHAQGYLIRVAPSEIEIAGNSLQGLFYGVQTLLQLIERPRSGSLPALTIRDWPRYALRIAHWDTKHHQDRPETLKRLFDSLARFKTNAVSLEIEDKFEYPSHPIIGAPGAFTVAEMQDLTRYALERYIQLIPNVQAPAHMTYVLKHKEFEHLKCDGNNYQACVEDPEAQRLIFDMYSDLCTATPGVDYFHVSTDEVYYAGVCEKQRKPYNPENRSLAFVAFVNAAHAHLSKLGRKLIIWGEHPLLAHHIPLLPNDIIDGVVGNDAMLAEELKHGMRHLAYASMQGEELLFPNYFATADDHGGGGTSAGRLADGFVVATSGKAARGNPIGTFCAAWEDSGLHGETFMLGWAAMAQFSWAPGQTTVAQTAADFMDVHYGRATSGLTEIYQLMQHQARFWQSIWDRPFSKVRPPAYGNSRRKHPYARQDWALSAPSLPALPDLSAEPTFSKQYSRLLAAAPSKVAENDRLIGKLYESLTRVQHNAYSLEVFLSLAYLMRHTLEMLMATAGIEKTLSSAHQAHTSDDPAYAASLLVQAHGAAGSIIAGRLVALRRLEDVWEKSRYPRNRSVGDKHFLHVMDDVKDHFADRRADLSYMTAPEETMQLERYQKQLRTIIETHAQQHTLSITIPDQEAEPYYG